jgi:hypothetical protein
VTVGSVTVTAGSVTAMVVSVTAGSATVGSATPGDLVTAIVGVPRRVGDSGFGNGGLGDDNSVVNSDGSDSGRSGRGSRVLGYREQLQDGNSRVRGDGGRRCRPRRQAMNIERSGP